MCETSATTVGSRKHSTEPECKSTKELPASLLYNSYTSCLWPLLFLAASSVNFSGQILFLVVNHCNAWSRNLLSLFLVRGGTYDLNHDILHDQLFGHSSICLTTGWHSIRCPICHYWVAQAGSQSQPPQDGPTVHVQMKMTFFMHYKQSHCLQLFPLAWTSCSSFKPEYFHLGWTATAVHCKAGSWLDPSVYAASAGDSSFPST